MRNWEVLIRCRKPSGMVLKRALKAKLLELLLLEVKENVKRLDQCSTRERHQRRHWFQLRLIFFFYFILFDFFCCCCCCCCCCLRFGQCCIAVGFTVGPDGCHRRIKCNGFGSDLQLLRTNYTTEVKESPAASPPAAIFIRSWENPQVIRVDFTAGPSLVFYFFFYFYFFFIKFHLI